MGEMIACLCTDRKDRNNLDERKQLGMLREDSDASTSSKGWDPVPGERGWLQTEQSVRYYMHMETEAGAREMGAVGALAVLSENFNLLKKIECRVIN